MARIFHFENDLYFINEQISVLRTIFAIEIDEVFFFDKLIEDIMFIDEAVGKISVQLKNNPGSIDMKHIYRNLSLTQKRYVDFLGNLIESEKDINLPIRPFIVKLKQIKQRHLEENNNIDEMLEDKSEDSNDLVSSEEYQFLFQDDANGE